MISNKPHKKVLKAFGLSSEPVLLPGGEGTCYRVGNVVLKPTSNEIESSWLARINSGLESDSFRVPKQIKTKDNLWVFDGWTASEFLEGTHKPGSYIQSIELSQAYHKALSNISKPDWFEKKTDIFAIADKIAWSELPLLDFTPAESLLQKAQSFLKENKLPNQLVHGDLGPEQILFHDTLAPAVLDMTPYFRPANYPVADMVISAMAHHDENPAIIDLGVDIDDFDQLLLRAIIFRTSTYIGFQIHPENNYDWTSDIENHLNLIDVVINHLGLK